MNQIGIFCSGTIILAQKRDFYNFKNKVLKFPDFRSHCFHVRWIKVVTGLILFDERKSGLLKLLTDTDKDSKLVQRRQPPKVDTLFSSLFSDASERPV